jgi:hypothetical protein
MDTNVVEMIVSIVPDTSDRWILEGWTIAIETERLNFTINTVVVNHCCAPKPTTNASN